MKNYSVFVRRRKGEKDILIHTSQSSDQSCLIACKVKARSSFYRTCVLEHDTKKEFGMGISVVYEHTSVCPHDDVQLMLDGTLRCEQCGLEITVQDVFQLYKEVMESLSKSVSWRDLK